ncbi:hypothetical protein VA599_07640 [Chromobacterium sp. TRC.1.1.SA]|uniref:GIY-YIG domain-containing protein n=1 Tax=Chromobacterium indicum TaxID=3110228 RepID=A0ABV0CHI1_9NEIS
MYSNEDIADWLSGSVFETTHIQPGDKVPWRHFRIIRNQSLCKEAGVYIFGVGSEILYVGETENSLRERITGRYIGVRGVTKTQCSLAEQIRDENVRYKRESISHVRWRGANYFLKRGIDQVWLMLIPSSDPKGLESRLISKYKPFLNIQGK